MGELLKIIIQINRPVKTVGCVYVLIKICDDIPTLDPHEVHCSHEILDWVIILVIKGLFNAIRWGKIKGAWLILIGSIIRKLFVMIDIDLVRRQIHIIILKHNTWHLGNDVLTMENVTNIEECD